MPNLRDTNITIIWGCGHRKAFHQEAVDGLYVVQVSAYPCAQKCDGWYWGEGPSDITMTATPDINVYIDLALTGTDDDRMDYPFPKTAQPIGAISCWLTDEDAENTPK